MAGSSACDEVPRSVRLWSVLLHIAIFATFFGVFFELRLSPVYDKAEEGIAHDFGVALADQVPPSARPALCKAVQAAATQHADEVAAAKEERRQRNGRRLAVMYATAAMLWIASAAAYWGLLDKTHRSVHGGTMVRGVLGCFVAFMAFELFMFRAVLPRYRAFGPSDVYRVYRDEMVRVAQECPP